MFIITIIILITQQPEHRLEISQVKESHMSLDLEVVSVEISDCNYFGCNLTYKEKFPKQGYKILFFPLPRCNYA